MIFGIFQSRIFFVTCVPYQRLDLGSKGCLPASSVGGSMTPVLSVVEAK